MADLLSVCPEGSIRRENGCSAPGGEFRGGAALPAAAGEIPGGAALRAAAVRPSARPTKSVRPPDQLRARKLSSLRPPQPPDHAADRRDPARAGRRIPRRRCVAGRRCRPPALPSPFVRPTNSARGRCRPCGPRNRWITPPTGATIPPAPAIARRARLGTAG